MNESFKDQKGFSNNFGKKIPFKPCMQSTV